MTPREVDELSLWEFAAAVEGWRAANGSTGGSMKAPTDEEFEEAKRQHGMT